MTEALEESKNKNKELINQLQRKEETFAQIMAQKLKETQLNKL
jgi:hypothetical protein